MYKTHLYSGLGVYRPSLLMNFAGDKSLDPRITFTRSSAGTCWDSSGTQQTAAVNEPRFTHNPSTLESLGLLIEEQRTNLLLNSETLSTQSVPVTATAHTLSFYGTGTVTLTGASTAGPLVGTASDELVTLTFTPSAGSLTLTVSGSVKYANLEVGSFATSWIPTTGSTATRAADNARITGTDFSSWYNQGEGTFVSQSISYSLDPRALSFSDGTTSNNIGTGSVNIGEPRLYISDSGVAQANISIASGGAVYKEASSYRQDDVYYSVNGSAASSDSSANIPSVSMASIGLFVVGGVYHNGTIASIAYYNRALPNYLQFLTT